MAPSGFRVEDHEIILYGVCRNCPPKRKTRPSGQVRR
jgi:Fe2+ or Zn2+ uptake regulation protein